MNTKFSEIISLTVVTSSIFACMCQNVLINSNAYSSEYVSLPEKKAYPVIYGWIDKQDLNEPKKKKYTDEDVTILSKLLYGEAKGVKSEMRQAAVIWCVLNRVDDKRWSDSIHDVATQNCQFGGYITTNPVEDHLKEIVTDVLERWSREKDGEEDVGRVLPPEYTFFCGGYGENWFYRYEDFNLRNKPYYDWSLPNPYET